MSENKDIIVENIDKLENLTVQQLGENITIFNTDNNIKDKDIIDNKQKNVESIDILSNKIKELNETETDIIKNKKEDNKENKQDPDTNLDKGKKNFLNFKKIKEITKSNLVKIFNNKKNNNINYNIIDNKNISTNINNTENNDVLTKEQMLGISKTVLNDKKVMMFSTIGIAITKLIKYLSNAKESSNSNNIIKNIINTIIKKETVKYLSSYLTKKGGLLEGISKTSWGTGKLSKFIKGASAVTAAYEVSKDAIGGYKKSEEWLGKEKGKTIQGKFSSTLGGAIGGTGSGLSGALANAGKGAAIGSLIAGPIGTAVGGLIGAGLGAIGGKRITKFFNGFIDITKKNWKVALGIIAPSTIPILLTVSLFKMLKNNWPFSKNTNPKDKADEEKRIEEEKKNNKDNIDKSKDKVIKEKDNTKAREENTKGLLEKLGDKAKELWGKFTGKLKQLGSNLAEGYRKFTDGQDVNITGPFAGLAKKGAKVAGITKGVITSLWGNRIHPVYGTKKMHQGVDIAGSKNTRVNSATGGKVIFAGQQKGYGNIVIVQDSEGRQFKYAHLNDFNVKKGDEIKQGQFIGGMGNTGIGTGTHLHFEVRNKSGQSISPYEWLGGSTTTVEKNEPENKKTNVEQTVVNNNQNNKQQVANIPKTVATNKVKKEQIADEKREQKLKQKEKNLNEDYSLYAKTTKEMNEKSNKKIVNKISEVNETIASNNSSTTTIINNTNDPLTNIKNEVYGVLI